MIKFWISVITAVSGLAILSIGGLLCWQALRLERAASIRPGSFTGYRLVDRGNDTALQRPVFDVERSDGTSEEVIGDFPHLLTFFAPGDAIEVLVPNDPERTPRIRSFGPLYALPSGLVVVGTLLVFFPFVLGGFRRAPERADYGSGSKERAPKTAWVGRGLWMVALALLGYAWAQTRGLLGRRSLDTDHHGGDQHDGTARDGDHHEAPPLAAADPRSESPTREIQDDPPAPRPVPQASRPSAPESKPKPKHRSPAHAARAGDHEALLEYIADGVDLNEINPANLVATISNGQVQALRVLFEHRYEHHRYAGDTLGDLGIKYNRPEVVKLVQEFEGPFDAPPEYIALVLGDPAALAAALAEQEGARNFMHRDLDWWAKELGQEATLERARRP